MRTEKELRERIAEYRGIEYLYTDNGYIAWQLGTGDNVEIMFIEVREKGKGYATELVREMCKRIKPYYSVYVFRLAANDSAGCFYRKLGFKELVVPWIYKGDYGVICSISYEELCQNLSINTSSGNSESKQQ